MRNGGETPLPSPHALIPGMNLSCRRSDREKDSFRNRIRRFAQDLRITT
jgi:hypothetical protein